MFSDTKRMSTFSCEPLNDKIGEKVRENDSPGSYSVREIISTAVLGVPQRKVHNSIFCDYWHPHRMSKIQNKVGKIFGDKCAFMHWQAEEQPSKKPKENGENSAVAILEDTRQLGCVFQDAGPPRSSILRKRTQVLRPSKRVRLTKATLSHVNIRVEKGTLLVNSCERSPHATKFEDRSRKERETKRCARGDAARLAKKYLQVKKKDEVTFFSRAEVWCLPAPSETKPEEREFAVHSGAC